MAEGLLLALVLARAPSACAQPPLDAVEIVDRANKVLRGESSHAVLTMRIVTPSWERSLDVEAWTRGRERALIVIHAPPKEKGNSTLRRSSEMWLWLPAVERVMKVPPTMMHSSWQGSDFTYEDIIKADSIVRDYAHRVVERSPGDGYETVQIRCDPKPDAPVVWGKVLLWSRLYPDGGVVPLREEDYNERGEKVRVIELSEPRLIDGVRVPMRLVCAPEGKGRRTEILYREIRFGSELPDSFFSLGRLQRSGG